MTIQEAGLIFGTVLGDLMRRQRVAVLRHGEQPSLLGLNQFRAELGARLAGVGWGAGDVLAPEASALYANAA